MAVSRCGIENEYDEHGISKIIRKTTEVTSKGPRANLKKASTDQKGHLNINNSKAGKESERIKCLSYVAYMNCILRVTKYFMEKCFS